MQVHRQNVTIRNTLNSHVEATLRAGSPERWTLSQHQISLKPQQSVDIQLQLKVLRFAQRRKASTQGQRDVFHISAPYFEQKWHATFVLAATQSGGAASAASRSTSAALGASKEPLPNEHRRQSALKALAGHMRSSASGLPPATRPVAQSASRPATVQPAAHGPDAGPETHGSILLSLEALAGAGDSSEGPHIHLATTETPSHISLGEAPSKAAQHDSGDPPTAAAIAGMQHSHETEGHHEVDVTGAGGCCPCHCHGGKREGEAAVNLAAQQRARELLLRLEAAEGKLELLQQAIADRDSTIRCPC